MGKPAVERETIADRIARIDADVLAVQELEDIDTLKRFNSEDLGGRYRDSGITGRAMSQVTRGSHRGCL